MRTKLLLTLGCVVFSRGAFAAAPSAAAPLPVPRLAFTSYALPNGLQVILSEDHRLPLTAVDLWYHVGAANEPVGKSGFAHLFEHLMFQGSKHVTGNEHVFFGILETLGASATNGTTDFDRTNYFETVPANQLQAALWLESDRQGFLLDALDQKKLDTQRKVVLNEKHQDENQPYARADERLYQLLFPRPHPYFGSVIGSEADLESATRHDVRAFFRTYYAPNNCTLAIAGDFDPVKVKAWVAQYFGPIPRGPTKPPVRVTTLPLGGEKRETLRDAVHLPKLVMGFLAPPTFESGDAEAALLADVLGVGKTSRLYERLVYEKQVAQDVSVSDTQLVLGSVLEIGVVARPGHTLEEVERAVQAELDDVREHPVSEEELGRAKADFVATTFRQLQHLGGFGGKADLLNAYAFHTGDPGYLAKDLIRYERVTPASLQAVARQVLRIDDRVVLQVLPAEPAAATPEPAAATSTE